jgi:hypothetical protein
MNEKTILRTMAIWLERSLGTPEVSILQFSTAFTLGQTIDITINTVPITQVTASATMGETMQSLLFSIQDHPDILMVSITSANELIIVGQINGKALTINSYLVVGAGTLPTMQKTVSTTAVSIPVIFGYQNAPRPDLPVYAAVYFDSLNKIGWDEIREIDQNKIANIGGQRTATISVHYFGPNPMQEISKAYNSLEKGTILDILTTNGIAVLEKNPIQNVTEMLETSFQNHSAFDFSIGFAENYFDDLGTIEQAELTGIYNNVDGESFQNGPDLINQTGIEPS